MINPNLIKIGSKEKAKALIDHFDEQNFFYVMVKTNNTLDLTPQLLRKVFPGYEFPWTSIFVIGVKSKGVSGIVVIDRERFNLVVQLLQNTKGIFIENGIAVTCKIVSSNDFRSGLLNCSVTSHYPNNFNESSKQNGNVEPSQPTKVHVDSSRSRTDISYAKALKHKQSGDKIEQKQSSPPQQVKRKQDKQTMTSPRFKDKETMTTDISFVTTVSNNNPLPLRVNKIIQVNIALQSSKKLTDSTTSTKNEMSCLRAGDNDENGESSDDLMEIDDDKFISITTELVNFVVRFLGNLDTRNRTIYLVCHTIFMDPQISMAKIRRVLVPVFEEIQADSVFVRSTTQAPLVAYGGGWAYIISSGELCKDILAIRAKEHHVLYGAMTMSCLLSDIKNKNYLMNKEALLGLGSPFTLVTAKAS